MRPIVISAFPGKGKSYMTTKCEEYKCIDSDSSKFHWIVDQETGDKKENPNFIDDYINHIKDNIEKAEVDVIFVSSHSDIRKALKDNNIPYFLIFGYYDEKYKYVDLYRKRGNSEKFIKNITSNYEIYTEGMDRETFPIKIKLHHNQFIDANLIKWCIDYNDDLATIKCIENFTDIADITQSCTKKLNIAPYVDKIGENMDWDSFSMYCKVPEEMWKTKPVNLFYIQKYGHLNKPQKKRLQIIMKNKKKK